MSLLPNSAPNTSAAAPCWCLCRGAAGMQSQVGGLAEAVGLEFEHRTCNLRFPFTWMLPAHVPLRSYVLRDPSVTSGGPPKLVISCGRHGGAAALAIKHRYGSQVLAVHLQDPKMRSDAFDLVVVPSHDKPRGENIYVTAGALHYVHPAKLAAARQTKVAHQLMDGRRPLIAVLLGGKNGCYKFDHEDISRLISNLASVVRVHSPKLVILPSRRTPQWAIDQLAERFSLNHFVWQRQGANPYFEAISLADYIVVTSDSVSMTSEATATGKPILIHHLGEKRSAKKFHQFHREFEAAGYTRPFEGRLEDWSYVPPNETQNVASLIQQKLSGLGESLRHAA